VYVINRFQRSARRRQRKVTVHILYFDFERAKIRKNDVVGFSVFVFVISITIVDVTGVFAVERIDQTYVHEYFAIRLQCDSFGTITFELRSFTRSFPERNEKVDIGCRDGAEIAHVSSIFRIYTLVVCLHNNIFFFTRDFDRIVYFIVPT